MLNDVYVLKDMEERAKLLDRHSFEGFSASELDVAYDDLDKLAIQADNTSYAISCLRDMVDHLSAEKRREEEEADYEIERAHNADLQSWWNGTRM